MPRTSIDNRSDLEPAEIGCLAISAAVVGDIVLVILVGVVPVFAFVFAGFLTAQLSLVSIWLGIGNRGFLWRLLTAALVGCTFCSMIVDPDRTADLALVGLILLPLIAIPTGLLKLQGLRLVQITPRAVIAHRPAPCRATRFNLRNMFLWTSLTAAMAFTVRASGCADYAQAQPKIAVAIGAGMIIAGCAARATVKAVFSGELVWPRLLPIALLSGVAAAAWGAALNFIGDYQIAMAAGTAAINPLMVAAALGWLRRAGYRLVPENVEIGKLHAAAGPIGEYPEELPDY